MAATPETEVNSGTFTPQSLILRRRLAEAMLNKGIDTSPIQHPTQGLARMAQAIIGGDVGIKQFIRQVHGQFSHHTVRVQAAALASDAAVFDDLACADVRHY